MKPLKLIAFGAFLGATLVFSIVEPMLLKREFKIAQLEAEQEQ